MYLELSKSGGKDGLRRGVKVRDFTLEVDEPVTLGIPLNDVSVKFEAEIDLRGLFAAADGVRPGLKWIEGTVEFDGPACSASLRRTATWAM